MDDVTKQALLSAFRTLLAIGGAALVSRGVFTESEVQQLSGVLVTLVPLVWGVVDKYLVERRTRAREAVALNVGQVAADNTEGATPARTVKEAQAIIESLTAAVDPSVIQPPAKDPK